MTLNELYDFAEQQNIDVDWCILKRAESLSAPLFDGSCAIAIDPTLVAGAADEKDKLAHEIGHCMTGTFYNMYAPLDERGRCEERATRWEIKNVLPFAELIKAVRRGITSASELADHFSVPISLVQKAIHYYTGPCGLTLNG